MATIVGKVRADIFGVQHGDVQLHQAVQLAVVIGLPLALAAAAGNLPWGVLAAFGGMIGTLSAQINGGPVRVRVGTTLATVLGVMAGAAFGSAMDRTSLLGAAALFGAAFVAGRMHGAHPVAETVARFAAVGVAIGVGLRPTAWSFALFYASGAALAVATTLVIARLRPPQEIHERGVIGKSVRSVLRGQAGSGTAFALIYACTVVLALLVAGWIGVSRPYWAALTVFLVMRPERSVSYRLALARTAGTLLGVLIAGAMTHLLADAARAAVAVAFAFLNPIARPYNAALGFGALTVVVMLLLDLLPAVAANGGLFAARFYDTFVACLLVLLGSWLARVLLNRQ